MSDLKNTLGGMNNRLDIVEGKMIEDKKLDKMKHKKTEKVCRIFVCCGNN